MRIRNQSKLPAKFEVVPQETNSLGLASFTVEPSSGGIPACGEQVVEVTLQTFTLGRIQIPVRVKALGSKSAPLEFIINARCIGPQLDFGDDPENRWGGTAGRGGAGWACAQSGVGLGGTGG